MKLVKSPGLWENMAHSSIKTRRPEVVDFCLSNMEHARAVQAARCASAAWCADLGQTSSSFRMSNHTWVMLGSSILLERLRQPTGPSCMPGVATSLFIC